VTDDLLTCLLAAERSARRSVGLTAALGAEAGSDPFRLVVPPLVDPGAADIDAATLETLAGLYLLAEVEQTGLLAAAELLVANRMSLDLRSVEAAELLEQTADNAQEWIARAAREDLFARVFGLGAAATSPHVLANGEFGQLLADTCSAIADYDRAAAFGGSLVGPRAQLSRAANRIRGNLALRRYGNTLIAAARIAAQAREAVTLLSHPGIVALVTGTSAWDVVRATWPDDDRPDVERLLDLGRSGQQVITWTGAPEASRADPPQPVREAAAVWLQSAGLAREAA
jgi:hypothetical protein